VLQQFVISLDGTQCDSGSQAESYPERKQNGGRQRRRSGERNAEGFELAGAFSVFHDQHRNERRSNQSPNGGHQGSFSKLVVGTQSTKSFKDCASAQFKLLLPRR
jgi:hypothetical protein